MSEYPSVTGTPAGLLRRLGAIVSDSLVVLGLLLLASMLFIPLLQFLNAKAMAPSEVGWLWSGIYWAWLLTIWIAFFGFFWTRRGQTIGMQAWRIRLEDERGALLNWSHALRRLWFATLPWLPCLVVLRLAEHYGSDVLKHLGQGLSLLGAAGLVRLCFDPQKRTWHDRISKSRVIMLPKP
ncbi:MAG: RDD family protein [Steroidobacteraceae bacterium]